MYVLVYSLARAVWSTTLQRLLLSIFIFDDPLETNYRRMCWTDLYKIFRIGTYTDGHYQYDLIFAIAQGSCYGNRFWDFSVNPASFGALTFHNGWEDRKMAARFKTPPMTLLCSLVHKRMSSAGAFASSCFRPHYLHTVHRCGLLLQMSHVAWSVCLSVCLFDSVLGERMCCTKTAEPFEMPFGAGLTHVVIMMHVLDGVRIPHKKGHFWGGHVPAHCNMPTRECIALYSPAAARECSCPAHTSDECIHSPPRGVTRRRCGLLPNSFGQSVGMHECVCTREYAECLPVCVSAWSSVWPIISRHQLMIMMSSLATCTSARLVRSVPTATHPVESCSSRCTWSTAVRLSIAWQR